MLRYKQIIGVFSDVVAQGSAELWSVNITVSEAGSQLSVYDGSSNLGPLVALIDGGQLGSYWFGVYCKNGMYVVTATTGSIFATIGYR